MDEFWERPPRKWVARKVVKTREIEGKARVFIGMRRTGKTTLCFQEIEKLVRSGTSQETILYLNFEDDRLGPLDQAGFSGLLDSFYQMNPKNHDRQTHFFLDEIQNVTGWPAVVRRYLDTKDVRMTLTGSSAKLLSAEIATSLRGRSVATEVWPLNFVEFCEKIDVNIPSSHSQKARDIVSSLNQRYLLVGGLPEVVQLDDFDRRRLQQDHLSVVILRDLIERHRIQNEVLLRKFAVYLLRSTGRLLSIHKSYQDLKSQGFSLSKNTLYQYLDYFSDCYLTFSVPLFSDSIRKQQSNPRKVYAGDTGLSQSQNLGVSQNLEQLFETLVYLDLRRHGINPFYYKTRTEKEVDFVYYDYQGRLRVIQVSLNVENPETKAREEAALNEAGKELNAKKLLVTPETYLEFLVEIAKS